MLSIIVPVYNVEKYLSECLESLVTQTFNNIEIICVNDGSTDKSLSILESYAKDDERIKIISKQNGGYASAVNAGIESANGEFIQIVESDDYCHKTMCEDLFNKIKDSDADFVTCDFYLLDKNSITHCKYLNAEDKDIEYFNLENLPYIIARHAYPWKNLYRTSFLKENNIKMKQDGKGAYEDQPWNATTLALAKKIVYVNKPLYYYRLDATGSSTNNGGRKMINYIARKAQTKEILEQNNLYKGDIKEHFANSAVGGCLFFFKRIAFEFKKEYYNEMKKFLNEILNDGISFKHFSTKNKKRLDNILTKDYYSYYKYKILKYNIGKLFNIRK